MRGFENRVAVVTGAGAGLGRSHAIGLAKEGAKVAVTDVSEAAARAVADEINTGGGEAVGLAADVADAAAVARMIDAVTAKWGAVDVLVNNAGILRDKSFGKLEPEDFDLVVKVHLAGSFNCAKAVWGQMRERRYGRILFTSSASGIYGNFGQANYGAAKAGMIGLMNVLHLEGAKYDIRVNTLAPTAATQMTAGLISEQVAAVLAPERPVAHDHGRWRRRVRRFAHHGDRGRVSSRGRTDDRGDHGADCGDFRRRHRASV